MRISLAEAKKIFGDNPAIVKLEDEKKNKYRNKKVYVYENGMVLYNEKNNAYGKPVYIFDSIKEYNRWNELKLMQKAGVIFNLDRQKEWIISEAGEYQGKKVRKISYKADFSYQRNGQQVVEDVKPFDNKKQKFNTTKDFDLKWKMLKLKFPLVVFELY